MRPRIPAVRGSACKQRSRSEHMCKGRKLYLRTPGSRASALAFSSALMSLKTSVKPCCRRQCSLCKHVHTRGILPSQRRRHNRTFWLLYSCAKIR